MSGDNLHAQDRAPQQNRDDKTPQPPPPAPRKSKMTDTERRAGRILFELNLRVQDTQKTIDAGQATAMNEAEIRSLAAAIEKNRSELLATLERLPTGDPLMMEAFDLNDRAAAILGRLDSMARAQKARTESAPDPAPSDPGENQQVLAKAAARKPVGYCDSYGKQDPVHCGSEKEQRQTWREEVTRIVLTCHTNWSLAIASRGVEERLKKDELRFEQQLGQMLLGLMFMGLGESAKFGVSKVTKAGAKALTSDVGTFPGVTEAPDEGDVSLIGKGLQSAAKKGVGAVEKKATGGHKSAAEVRQEAEVKAPADRTAFLAVLKSAPTQWSNAILGNLTQLYDEDLAALSLGLPASAPNVGDFEKWIDDLLKRFTEQVGAVNREIRPMQVVGKNGRARHALVTAELRPDGSLHGDSRNSMVDTGKTRFVRWVDEDMAAMANARSVEEDRMNVMQQAHRFDDAAFWSDDSLEVLARDSSPRQDLNPMATPGAGRS